MKIFNFNLWVHWSNIYQLYYIHRGHAMAQFVEALRYKPEGRGLWFPMVSLEEISSFRSEIYEKCALLGCYSASSGKYVLTNVSAQPIGRAIGSFQWRNPSCYIMVLSSTPPLEEMSNRSIFWKEMEAKGACCNEFQVASFFQALRLTFCMRFSLFPNMLHAPIVLSCAWI